MENNAGLQQELPKLSRLGILARQVMLLGLCVGAHCAIARSQTLIPIDGDTGTVYRIVSVGDEVWLSAAKGLFRVDRKSNQAVRVGGDYTGRVTNIASLGDEIWLWADSGLCRLDRKSNQAVHVTGDFGESNEIASAGGEMWLASETGLFRLDRNSNQAVRVRGNFGEANEIGTAGGEIWLGAQKGLFRIDLRGNQAASVVDNVGAVDRIVSAGDQLWMRTQHGLFHVDRNSNQAELVTGDIGDVHEIVPFGDEIWLGTSNGLFRLDRNSNQATRVGGDVAGVRRIVSGGNKLWVITGIGLFHVDQKGNQAVPVLGDPGKVLVMHFVGDELWLGAQKGLFHVDGKSNQATLVGDTGGVFSMVTMGDETWLGTDKGLFRLDLKRSEVVRVGADPGIVLLMLRVGDDIWFKAQRGLFRVDRGTKIQVKLEGGLVLPSRFSGTRLWIEGNTRPIVQYVDPNSGLENYSIAGTDPSVVYDSNLERMLEKSKRGNNWSPVTPEGPMIHLSPGHTRLYFAVRDQWHNDTTYAEPQLIEGWVIPTWSLTFLLPISAAGFCLLCLALAPWVRYCHMLLMNPFLRNWASFGTVPLLLTALPPLRRHIFRRYCRGLSFDDKFQSLARRYVIPEERFKIAVFARTLTKHRVLGLHGQSGIGKSAFLTYLAHEWASQGTEEPTIRRLTPVFIDLSIAGGQSPETLVRSELRKYGDLTDEKLTDALLDDGGFLFLFDGLNEITYSAQLAIVQFADLRRKHSCTCVSTQVATEELRQVSTLVASSLLTEEKVRELVRLKSKEPEDHKKKFDAGLLLREFNDETYRICQVPFQLELIVEMWEARKKTPRSLDEIYSFALGSMIDKKAWAEKGHSDFPDILCELAFKMLTEKRPYDPKDDYLPDELKSELVIRKLLVDRGEMMEFRHDRLRAYLAARYFGLWWRTLLASESTLIDPNWDTMLEFYLAAEQSEDTVRELMFLLAKKNVDIAVRLSRWGQENQPELFAGWLDEFSKEIGRRILGFHPSAHGST